MVRLVSAMLVARMSLRRPAAAGCQHLLLRVAGPARRTADARRRRASRAAPAAVRAARWISGEPGRNTSTSPSVSSSTRRTCAAMRRKLARRQACAAPAAPAGLARGSGCRPETRAPRPSMTGASPSRGATAARIERGRHHQQPQRQRQRLLRLAAQRQAQIRMQAAFVEFVEQHGRHAFQRRVLLQHARQDALGDHLEPRARADARVQPHAVAHRFADALAQRLRHALRHRPRGQPARLQQQDACGRVAHGSSQQRQRHHRALARAGRRHQHGIALAAQRRHAAAAARLRRAGGLTSVMGARMISSRACIAADSRDSSSIARRTTWTGRALLERRAGSANAGQRRRPGLSPAAECAGRSACRSAAGGARRAACTSTSKAMTWKPRRGASRRWAQSALRPVKRWIVMEAPTGPALLRRAAAVEGFQNGCATAGIS